MGFSAAIVAIGAGCANVQPGSPTLEQRFQRLDANGDGLLTWEEALPSRSRDFRGMDKDRNGRVTPVEFRGSLPFATFDANNDGAASSEEYLAAHRRMFMKFDENGDRHISPSEFAAAQRAAGNVE